MKKGLFIILTTIALFLAGGILVVWSVYQKQEVETQSGNLKEFTDDNFQQDVVEASKDHPILVDFYAEWCFPCKMLDPVLEEIAKEMSGRAVLGKVDTDKNMIARRFGINRIPAVFIIRHGEVKESFYGLVPKETLVKALTE